MTTPPLPQSKMGAVALAGSLTTIIVWILDTQGVSMPPEVAAAIATVLAFAAGYLR
jgi:hypothetical protein